MEERHDLIILIISIYGPTYFVQNILALRFSSHVMLACQGQKLVVTWKWNLRTLSADFDFDDFTSLQN